MAKQTRETILNGYEFSAPKWFDFANVEAAEQDGARADNWFDTTAVNGATGRLACMIPDVHDHNVSITALKSPLEHADENSGDAQGAKENSQPNTKPIVPPLNLGILKQV